MKSLVMYRYLSRCLRIMATRGKPEDNHSLQKLDQVHHAWVRSLIIKYHTFKLTTTRTWIHGMSSHGNGLAAKMQGGMIEISCCTRQNRGVRCIRGTSNGRRLACRLLLPFLCALVGQLVSFGPW